MQRTLPQDFSSIELYLDLMMRVLINHIYQDNTRSWHTENMDAIYNELERANGEDHPHLAHTMIGWKRLANIKECFERIVADNVEGDLIETGVWRGGAVILMRALLKAYQIQDRNVWVADSFDGVPAPTSTDDSWSNLHELTHLRIPIDEVKHNFAKYGLLDQQVKFLPGLFQDTLKSAPIEKLSLIRLDGDLYESTMVALEQLYPRLSEGGFAIIDDYHTFEACAKATDEYRERYGIKSSIHKIDRNAIYWRKS